MQPERPLPLTPSPLAERGDTSAGPLPDLSEPGGHWQAAWATWERLRPRARELRHEATPDETRLWQALRAHRLAGLSFRRQHVIGSYIVDFYCHEKRIVIEVDGSIHDTQVDDDQYRQEIIEARGLTVLRFQNHEVTNDLPSVLERIMTAANIPSSISPSPQAGRGPGGGVSS